MEKGNLVVTKLSLFLTNASLSSMLHSGSHNAEFFVIRAFYHNEQWRLPYSV